MTRCRIAWNTRRGVDAAGSLDHTEGDETFFRVSGEGRFTALYPGRLSRNVSASREGIPFKFREIMGRVARMPGR